MAARRLLIVMLVLLGISTIAGLMIPAPRGGDSPATAPTTATAPGTEIEDRRPPTERDPFAERGAAAARPGRLLAATIDADASRLQVVPVHVGDQLALTVRHRRFDLVAIVGMGLLEPVSADAPAMFDLLLQRPGTVEVRLVHEDRLGGRIRVRAPKAAPGVPPRRR